MLFEIDGVPSFEINLYDNSVAREWKKLIKDITSKGIKCLVAVPFLYPQDAVDGVESEIHHQEDLTPRIMRIRYPELELFLSNNFINGYAYYTNYLKWVK
jgi:hypothetical protein